MVVVEVDCSKRRTSVQARVEEREGTERGTTTREDGGREAGGGGGGVAAAAAHLWALSLILCRTATGSALISALTSAVASRWPRVMGRGAGGEARDERRGGGDEREEREERWSARESER